jgi:tape measure domain-containing protein
MAQNIVFKISADTSNFDAGLKKTGTEVDNVNKKTKQATAEVGQFQKALGNIGTMVAGAFAVSELIAFGKEMTKVSAQMESLRVRLDGLYGSQEKGTDVFSDLSFMANKYGIELKTLTENYASFVAGAKASGMELGKAEKIFKSMTIAIQGSGANAETAKRAFVALTQMIGKGKIQAEELRGQLGEAMPAAFGIMAKSLGVTTQELDKMMASGNLIASEVLPKFAEEMENAFGENASKLASGLQADLSRLENAWTALYLTAANSGASVLGVKILIGTIKTLQNAFIGARATFSALIAPFDGGEAMDNFLIDLEKAGIEEYEAEYRAFQQRQIDSFITTSEEQKKTSKETSEQLIKDAEYADSKRIELLKKVGKITKEEQANIDHRYGKTPEVRAKVMKDLIDERNKLTEDEQKQLIELRVKADLYRQAVESLKLVKEKTKELTEDELKELRKEEEKLAEQKQKAQKDIKDWLTAQAKIHLETRSGLVGPQQTREQANMGMGIDERTKKEMQSQFEEAQTNLEHAHKMGEKTEEQYLRAKLALYEKYGQDKRKVEEEIYAFEQGFAKERTKEVWTEAQSRVYATDKTLETLNMLNNAYTQSQTNQLQKQLEQGVISQEQYEQSLRKINRRQAVIDKAGALFNIAINT